MSYKLRLPLHLQLLRQPQHEQYTHTRMLEVRDHATRNTLSEGILDCPGARTLECTRGLGNSVVYHHMNSPEALNMKAGEKLVSTILAASTVCQESRLGTTSGKGYYSPNVRVDGLGATCSPLGLLPGAAPTKGCWTFFLRKRLCTVRNYYWSERLIARNKTEKPFDEPPTDQEHRPRGRADQAHRTQLIARSIISFGCLSLVKSVFVFVYCFFE